VIVKMFSVVDTKVGAFMNPFYAMTNGQAMRMFGDSVQDGKGPAAMHPEDYELYYVGEFDDGAGRLDGVVPAVFVCRGTDFVKEEAVEQERRKAGVFGVQSPGGGGS